MVRPQSSVPGSGAVGGAPGATRRRLSATERREQLVGIGLRLLADHGTEAATVEAVAAEAGISRSLLFHYFPTKRAFHVAVVEAAARRTLRAASPAPGTRGEAALRSALEGYLALVRRRRDLYLALTRGAGADADAARVLAELRGAFGRRLIDLLEAPPPAEGLERLAVDGWLALVEEVALLDADRGEDARDPAELAAFLVEGLAALRAAARR